MKSHAFVHADELLRIGLNRKETVERRLGEILNVVDHTRKAQAPIPFLVLLAQLKTLCEKVCCSRSCESTHKVLHRPTGIFFLIDTVNNISHVVLVVCIIEMGCGRIFAEGLVECHVGKTRLAILVTHTPVKIQALLVKLLLTKEVESMNVRLCDVIPNVYPLFLACLGIHPIVVACALEIRVVTNLEIVELSNVLVVTVEDVRTEIVLKLMSSNILVLEIELATLVTFCQQTFNVKHLVLVVESLRTCCLGVIICKHVYMIEPTILDGTGQREVARHLTKAVGSDVHLGSEIFCSLTGVCRHAHNRCAKTHCCL